jgi:hypothetical protein
VWCSFPPTIGPHHQIVISRRISGYDPTLQMSQSIDQYNASAMETFDVQTRESRFAWRKPLAEVRQKLLVPLGQ